MNQNIHVLSRAVVIDKGQILLCKTVALSPDFFFLPGGHIEQGEGAQQALLRELREIYIVFLFALGAGWSLSRMIRNMKNLLPAGGIAFTSGCSLSTMPWTIEGTAKTLHNPELAKALIPATTNIQQVGDCITHGFLCFLIYTTFYGHTPELMMWIPFSIVFVLARFATAGVLGGAVFVMLPIYETYLDFNGEMIALILALNVILDPLVTSGNVLANGALCRTYERVWNRVQTLIEKPQPIEVKVS